MRSKSDGVEGHFTASRSMPWFPIGLSVMVTAFSSINFMAFPSEVFKNGLYVFIALPVFIIVAIPVTRWVIPFFYELKLVSVYQFLETKFDLRVRLLASGFFIIWRVVWMAVALYAAGRILKATLGIPLEYVIVFSGLIATVYTSLGGIRSVIWTDLAQFFILFGGIVVGTVMAVDLHPEGVYGIAQDCIQGGLLKPYVPFDPSFFSLDPTARITFWSGIIGTFVAFFARYSSDQVVVQRYFTARSLSALRKAFWLNACAAVCAIGILGLFGLAIFSFATQSGLIAKGLPPLKYMGLLIQKMPMGVSGLIASGLMAATMSSIDSGINSCSAVWSVDFKQRLFNRTQNAKDALRFSLLLGIAITATAIGLIYLLGPNQSLFKIINKLINGLGSPLLAIMLAGMIGHRFTASGVFWGGVIGFALSMFVSIGLDGISLHYYGVINFVGTIVLCYALSVIDSQIKVRLKS